MSRLDFRDRLRQELARRRRVNPRYSLRAFGEFLSIDHSTLSQILRGQRPLPSEYLRNWAAKLNLGAEETAVYEVNAEEGDFTTFERTLRRRQWIGEAAILMKMPAHWQLLQLLRAPDWRPDMRWVAMRIGVSIDDANDAMSRLLRLRLLRIDADGCWRDVSGLDQLTEQGVTECALQRIRLAMSAG